ncbi:MAG: hypothetical protein Q8Q18_01125 [bacterium]|nr:hypothetical protein [bacterium]
MDTIKISKKRINLGDARLEQATIKDYGKTINVHGDTGGADIDIDLETGNVHSATISTDAVTFTFSNPPASGTAGSFTLVLTNGGSQDIFWPAAVNWPSGTAPSLSATGVDMLTFITPDAGTTWYGAVAISGAQLTLQSTYGYFVGGQTGTSAVATADRITYATGITAAHTASNLPAAKGYFGGLSDRVTYGYFGGGYAGSPVATTNRLTFSTGAVAANAASDLSVARYFAAHHSDGSTYGYFSGGVGASALTDRIVFSTSVTSSNTASNLIEPRYGAAGLSDGSTYGYTLGGFSVTNKSNVDRLTYSTSTSAAQTASVLSSSRFLTRAVSDASLYGYILGGSTDGGSTTVTTTDRIVFSTSTISAHTAANLEVVQQSMAASSDGTAYGYVAGGNSAGTTASVVATAHRITFSTGETAANAASNLSQARTHAGGVSDSSV